MDFGKLAKQAQEQAQRAIDKRGGNEALKQDLEELKDIARGPGSASEKAKRAAEARSVAERHVAVEVLREAGQRQHPVDGRVAVDDREGVAVTPRARVGLDQQADACAVHERQPAQVEDDLLEAVLDELRDRV